MLIAVSCSFSKYFIGMLPNKKMEKNTNSANIIGLK